MLYSIHIPDKTSGYIKWLSKPLILKMAYIPPQHSLLYHRARVLPHSIRNRHRTSLSDQSDQFLKHLKVNDRGYGTSQWTIARASSAG